ncbi:hypothetical protein BYI23_D015620 (plasmid) [Burkholderia sp. YI23]|nr:hypothetical protein BYI23_D015620 [Burkholderia sp. YI23]
MLKLARSTSTDSNPHFAKLERAEDETNTAWGERAVSAMKSGGPERSTYIVLLGGSDTLAFRLRVAQSHVRPDMLPSFWSESILVNLQGNTLDGAKAIHVPLHQPEGPAFAARVNGVVERPLIDFDDPKRYPNIAVVAMPVKQNDVLEKVERFKQSRSTLDALEHVLRWLAFAWGAARTPNPLHENYGLPSTCMIETVCAAANFDLTPGLESRASCPEAIWSAASYWHAYFAEFNGREPIGRYWTPHSYPIQEPGTSPSQAAPVPPKRARVAKAARTDHR